MLVPTIVARFMLQPCLHLEGLLLADDGPVCWFFWFLSGLWGGLGL